MPGLVPSVMTWSGHRGPGLLCRAKADPFRDVSDDGWVDVLCREVFRRSRRAGAGKEQVVVGGVNPEGDLRLLGQAGSPAGEVVVLRDLIVAPTLQEQHRFAQRGG